MMNPWEFLFLLLSLSLGACVYEKGNPDSRIPKAVVLLIAGATAAAILMPTHDWGASTWLSAITLAIGLAVGISFSPGNPVGAALHHEPPPIGKLQWYQIGPARKNWVAAMASLGFARAFLPLALTLILWAVAVTISTIGWGGDLMAQAIQTISLFAFLSVAPFLLILISSMVAAPLAIVIALRMVGGPIKRPDATDPGHGAETERSNEAWMLQDVVYGTLLGGCVFIIRIVFWDWFQ